MKTVLYLKKNRFPNDNFDSYSITAQEVRDVLESGNIPEIRLLEEHQGPDIAILMAVEKHPDHEEADYYIPEYYVEALIRNGANPVFIGFDKTTEQLENINPRALMLIGGDFKFPDEWVDGYQPEGGSLRRENAYEKAYNFAAKNRLPLLGICAGEQVLAGMFGAKLATVDGHRVTLNESCHNINIVPETLLARLSKMTTAKVNSNHHLAVKDVGSQCIVAATADDGTIEAIELKHPRHYFVLGVQWHPERFAAKGDPLTDELFGHFVRAARGFVMINEESEPFAKANLVKIEHPQFIIDMMYASTENIVNQPIYQNIGFGNQALVRHELWERLQKAIPWLEAHNLKMKIFDAYRPPVAHMSMKAAIHEDGPGLFASRAVISKHCHGTAIDVALCDLDGNLLSYPTPIDCYSAEYAAQIKQGKTDEYYTYCKRGRHDFYSPEAAKEISNREQLRDLMESIGLKPYQGEWWHYEMPDEFNFTFPVIEW